MSPLNLAPESRRPCFIWLHLAATHYPYNPETRFRPTGHAKGVSRDTFASIVSDPQRDPAQLACLQELYEACVRQSDNAVATLLPLLSAARDGVSPPIIAIFSDHGAHLGEKGLWFSHSTPYRPSLHVPLILHSPGRIPSGRTESKLVRLIDLGPTLLDYVGLEHTGFEGRTLRPLVEGSAVADRVNQVFVRDLSLFVVENERYKLIAGPKTMLQKWPEFNGLQLSIAGTQLYAWRQGPDEQHDIAEREPLIVGEMWRSFTTPRASVERMLTPQALRLLEQAGYAAPASE